MHFICDKTLFVRLFGFNTNLFIRLPFLTNFKEYLIETFYFLINSKT
jgi:hypothetical protein